MKLAVGSNSVARTKVPTHTQINEMTVQFPSPAPQDPHTHKSIPADGSNPDVCGRPHTVFDLLLVLFYRLFWKLFRLANGAYKMDARERTHSTPLAE